MASEFLTVAEVAEKWRVTAQTVYGWIRDGKCAGLFFRTPGRSILFFPEKIAQTQGTPADAFVRQRRRRADTLKSLAHHFGHKTKKKARA